MAVGVLLLLSLLATSSAARPKDVYAEEVDPELRAAKIREHHTDETLVQKNEVKGAVQLQERSSVGTVQEFINELHNWVSVEELDEVEKTKKPYPLNGFFSMAVNLNAALTWACEQSASHGYKKVGSKTLSMALAVRGLILQLHRLIAESTRLSSLEQTSLPSEGNVGGTYDEMILKGVFAPLPVAGEVSEGVDPPSKRIYGLMYSIYVLQQYREDKFPDFFRNAIYTSPDDSPFVAWRDPETHEVDHRDLRIKQLYDALAFDLPKTLYFMTYDLAEHVTLSGVGDDEAASNYVKRKVAEFGDYDPNKFTLWSREKKALVADATKSFLTYVSTRFGEVYGEDYGRTLPAPKALKDWH